MAKRRASKAGVQLMIDKQPPAEWYKDEGDKHFEFRLKLDGEPGKDTFGTHERVPIHITLMYEGGKIVEDQHSLLECLPPAPVMELREKQSALKIRIKEVSSRHRHQQFILKAELAGIEGVNDVTTDPIRVLSKHTRHNRKRKRREKATSDADGFDAVLAKEDPVRLTVEVLRSLEWLNIGQDKSVQQCPSCTAVHLVGVNNKVHKPRCKLRHLISVFSRAPQGGAMPAATPANGAAARKQQRVAHHLPVQAVPVAPAGVVVPTGVRSGAGMNAGAGAGMMFRQETTVTSHVPRGAVPKQPSFDFEKELALELVDSMPETGGESTLGKLARNLSIGSLMRSFSWGRSVSQDGTPGAAAGGAGKA